MGLQRFKQIFKQSLFKMALMILLLVLTNYFSDRDFIRSFEDGSFDTMSIIIGAQEKGLQTDNKVLILKIDDHFLKEKGLLNEHNNTKYGYLFPRDILSGILTNLFEHTQNYELDLKSVFIDYDLTYPSCYGNGSTMLDQALIETLKTNKKVKVYIPGTKFENYIFNEANSSLLQKVSVTILEDPDHYERSYLPVDEGLISLPIALSNECDEEPVQIGEEKWKYCGKVYENFQSVQNRFMFRGIKTEYEDPCTPQESFWKNIYLVSAGCDLENIDDDLFNGADIFVGSFTSKTQDLHYLAGTIDSSVMENENRTHGTYILANTYMTLLDSDGGIKKLSLIYTIIVLSLLTFLVEYFGSYLAQKSTLFSKYEFVMTLIILSLSFVVISFILLSMYNIWINWFLAWATYELIEFMNVIKNWFEKKIIRKSEA